MKRKQLSDLNDLYLKPIDDALNGVLFNVEKPLYDWIQMLPSGRLRKMAQEEILHYWKNSSGVVITQIGIDNVMMSETANSLPEALRLSFDFKKSLNGEAVWESICSHIYLMSKPTSKPVDSISNYKPYIGFLAKVSVSLLAIFINMKGNELLVSGIGKSNILYVVIGALMVCAVLIPAILKSYSIIKKWEQR